MPNTLNAPASIFPFGDIAEMVGDPRMMMPPRPGGMHMMGRGGGFPPPGGHPMDYYFHPYMEDYYGGARPPYGKLYEKYAFLVVVCKWTYLCSL